MKPFFSIIIPTYNSQQTIKKAISSVLSQKKNYEVVIVDDCSKDTTITFLERLVKKNKQFRLLKNYRNKGVSETRNKALKAATGEYVIFLDSDDHLFSNSLGKLEKFIKLNKNPDVVFGRFEKKTFPKNNDLFIKELDLKKNNFIKFKKLILEKNFPLDECWPYIVKRNFLNKNNLNFFNVRVAEDQLFVLKMFLKMKTFFIFKNNFYYHNNLSGTLSDFMNYNYSKCCLNVIIEYYKLLDREKDTINKRLIEKYIQSCFSMFIAIFVTLNRKQILTVSKILKNKKVKNFYYKNSDINFFKLIQKYGYFRGVLEAKNLIVIKKKNKIKKFIKQSNNVYFYCYSKFLNASFNIIGKDLMCVKGILDENKKLWRKKFKKKIIFNPKSFFNNTKFKNIKIIINNHRIFTINKIVKNLKKNNVLEKNILILDY